MSCSKVCFFQNLESFYGGELPTSYLCLDSWHWTDSFCQHWISWFRQVVDLVKIFARIVNLPVDFVHSMILGLIHFFDQLQDSAYSLIGFLFIRRTGWFLNKLQERLWRIRFLCSSIASFHSLIQCRSDLSLSYFLSQTIYRSKVFPKGTEIV